MLDFYNGKIIWYSLSLFFISFNSKPWESSYTRNFWNTVYTFIKYFFPSGYSYTIVWVVLSHTNFHQFLIFYKPLTFLWHVKHGRQKVGHVGDFSNSSYLALCADLYFRIAHPHDASWGVKNCSLHPKIFIGITYPRHLRPLSISAAL